MSSETFTPQPTAPALSGSPPQGFRDTWLYRFILFPIGQMLVFIVGAAVLMTLISFLLAVLFPEPRENIQLATQIQRQLPGMIISGITKGYVYAMIALGYTLVYGVLKFINFAHSEIFMVGSAAGFAIIDFIDRQDFLAVWNPIPLVFIALVVGMLTSGVLAVVIERVAYRPLRGAPRLVPLITAIGISYILIDSTRIVLALSSQPFNMVYPLQGLSWMQPTKLTFFEPDVNLRTTQVIIVVASVLMMLGLNYFVNATRLGKGIRAVSQDRTTAALMGINVNLMISLTFFVGGALGGAAGVLFGMNVGTVTPTVGFIPGIKAFTAAVLGGIGNVTGALLGGLLLGMIESFLEGLLPFFPALGTRYTDIFAFLVLILVLIFRPSGLLGERVDEKV